MESDDAARPSVTFHIVEHIFGLQTPTVVTGDQIPHDDTPTQISHGAVFHKSHPSVRGTEKVV